VPVSIGDRRHFPQLVAKTSKTKMVSIFKVQFLQEFQQGMLDIERKFEKIKRQFAQVIFSA
jgi:hypothetical protein